VDCAGYLIWVLERLGLARDVWRVSPALIARRSIRAADAMPQTPLVVDESA
jgi:hypothetical protein